MRNFATCATLTSALFLAACGSGPPGLITVPPSAEVEPVRIAYRLVEVRDVSLPDYAAAEDIYIEGADLTLTPLENVLWADDPERAVSLQLTRDLARITGAQVASAPWPLVESSQAQIEIRIESSVANTAGQFRISGQYFVAALDGGRDRSAIFDLSVPLGGISARAFATARSAVVAELAGVIARDGLR